jgi:predicted glycoside hydrolase/deacetylase ChbG (UPF0249 family)
MEKLLIVNADDFGLSKGQNYGIIEAFRHGVVSSTTAMVNCEHIQHAAELSRQYPDLPVGLHFVLTYGQPLSAMLNLVDEKGSLGKWLWQRAEKNTLDLAEIAHELKRQFEYFVEVFGRPPSHIDSHHHVHMLPQIYPLVEAFAREKNLPLRIDRDEVKRHNIQINHEHSTSWLDCDFYGEKITQQLFLQCLDHAEQRGDSSLEIMCHPAFIDNILLTSGYCYPRVTELDVLTLPSLKQEILVRGYRLGGFREL